MNEESERPKSGCLTLEQYQRVVCGDSATAAEVQADRSAVWQALTDTGDLALQEIIALCTGFACEILRERGAEVLGLKEKQMQVIKPGKVPPVRTTTVTCPHCHAVLEITPTDVQEHGSQGGYGDSSTASYSVRGGCGTCGGYVPCESVLNWPSVQSEP